MLSLDRRDHLIGVDPVNQVAVAQAGVVTEPSQQLQRDLKNLLDPAGLFNCGMFIVDGSAIVTGGAVNFAPSIAELALRSSPPLADTVRDQQVPA